jgi:glutathione S-transferase
MQLYATPLSHFSRKVRLLLDHYELEYECIDVGNVAQSDVGAFHGNPLMRVPVLRAGDLWLIDSDHIAAWLVRTYDPDDEYDVLTHDPEKLNARAVLNGIMTDEVKIILAERTGLTTAPHAFFRKARTSIEQGLAWLENRAAMFNAERPGYLEFHLISLWDHLRYYGLFELEHPALDAICSELGRRPRIAQSAPQTLKPRDAPSHA